MRVYSGIQSSGVTTLGNYLGALKQWSKMQHVAKKGMQSSGQRAGAAHASSSLTGSRFERPVFCIVDLHAMTSSLTSSTRAAQRIRHEAQAQGLQTQSKQQKQACVSENKSKRNGMDMLEDLKRGRALPLRDSVRVMAATMLACGIDADTSIIYQQSAVPEHTELHWILSCLAPMNELRHMTQFKQKSSQTAASNQEDASVKLGLLAYPVLMAADVMLLRATHVPVGEDQMQHLELARLLIRATNKLTQDIIGTEEGSDARGFFPVPETIIPEQHAARVMSLRDPLVKMSKSDPQPQSRIEMTDTADAIREKVKRAVTDSEKDIYYDPKGRPGVSNMLRIISAVEGIEVDKVAQELGDGGGAGLKARLTECLVEEVVPIGEKIGKLMEDLPYIDGVLQDGAANVRQLAQPTMQFLRDRMGLR